MASALGIRSCFVCGNCSRHLAVSRGWRAALAAALLLGFLACRVVAHAQHSHLPYLALPFILALATLVACQYGAIRIATSKLGWISLFNLGIFGTAALALDYAISL